MTVVELERKEENKKIMECPLESVTPKTNSIEEASKEGLLFILEQFNEGEIWPRTVSTKLTNNSQIPVYSIKEAIDLYKNAEFKDCKINAYPYFTEFKGINRQEPNLIFAADLDKSRFESIKLLITALARTRTKIAKDIGGHPTILWTGNGFHAYQPVAAPILELESQFSKFDRPSTKLLKYAEYRFTNGKTDPSHNTTISIKNCMLRVPWSINSKNSQQVLIIQKCNGVRPKINPILFDFYIYLANKKIVEQQLRQQQYQKRLFGSQQNSVTNSVGWIERLLNTGLNDHRKYAITFILAPYLINIKNQGYGESFNNIQNWLYSKCEPLRQLDSTQRDFDRRIKDSLDSCMRKGWKPISLGRLKGENKDLYSSITFSCLSNLKGQRI
jgi:Primase X